MSEVREIRHAHLFCGLGGGAKGFNAGEARVGSLEARFRCLGGIDVDAAAIRDFERMSGVRGTVLDLFDAEQFTAFHGRAPAPGWREAVPADIHAAFGGERPHIIFLSAPCKGFSGLLAETKSLTDKYQALNALTLRGVWLALEAYADDPVELFVFENVPRIATRGRLLVDRIKALFQAYGYAVAEDAHDCGELGGLGQSRKRFLLVARHQAKVPPFLYEPPKRPLRGVGEILERLPLPGDIAAAGPMHRMPSLQWKTWVRLAFVEAGSDWRSLNRLRVEGGQLADYAIEPEAGWHGGVLGVRRWEEPSGVVTSRGTPATGAFAVADPRQDHWGQGQMGVGAWQDPAATITTQRAPGQGRFAVADPRVDGHAKSVQLGVRDWSEPAAVVKGDVSVGTGPYAVADPRIGQEGPRFNNVYRIVRWGEPAPAVTGQGGNSASAVADPRPSQREDYKQNKYRITRLDEPAGAVIAASTTGNGAFALADPRMTWGDDSHRNKLKVIGYQDPAGTVTGADRVGSGALSVADPRPRALSAEDRDAYLTGGHYGVVPWDQPSGAVPANAKNNNGPWSVADPRIPGQCDHLVCVIRSLDNTWHRPFTTLELAALQSLFDPEDRFELDGKSDSAWRERIGNAVPAAAAKAIASTMGTTLLLAWSGETFLLSEQPIWVRPLAVMLAVDTAGAAV